MKHPHKSSELYEFNLGRTPDLRCVHYQANTVCGKCESCLLTNRFSEVQEWFFRAGDLTRKRFLFGLIDRSRSKDLLKNVRSVLHPMTSKDFTYASCRTTPGLAEDCATVCMDRALDPYDTEGKIVSVLRWYEEANYWTKSNFLMMILRKCEPHLLSTIFAECKKAITELEEEHQLAGDYEASSIDSSHYTYNTSEHPELDLLTSVQSEYDEVTRDPFTPFSSCYEYGNEESEDNLERPFTAVTIDDIIEDNAEESFDEDEVTDPRNLCDFIHHLPVHLSKYILSMLDFDSLNNCVCVSKVWRTVAEQVHAERRVGQSVREEVMLMQGSGAQGFNPKYAADIYVAVPNMHINSFRTVRTGEAEMETRYKSEISFSTAYSGYSTRNIIMEERNVYCGAYNVLVLSEKNDPHRVIHTDGGNWIALGSNDNRVRFISVENGKSVGPVISGHAGSVCCVLISESNRCIYSGSYDTSIRCWSLDTGKCLKIFRGHRDTVLCIKLHNSMLVSGGKDRRCKVWDIQTKKCLRTFQHKFPIGAVALSDELVISGCHGAIVKVWDLASGKLIKKLTGHHGPVTAIQLDKWHIVSGSKGGYALVWSTQGDHSRCLAALRHPKEVLCLEFMYLRVVTGAADGKIRIWNLITGECLRIMRGNSHSDPINCLIAIGNRITLNTARTLLVLNFEPIEYNYFLESDRIPPRVRYSNYGDTPIRKYPYPYVRAHRMKSAGASNTKIVKKDEGTQAYHSLFDTQIPHSGRSLSHKSMSEARGIQSAKWHTSSAYGQRDSSRISQNATKDQPRKPPSSAPATLGKHRTSLVPSAAYSRGAVNKVNTEDSDDDGDDSKDLSRRISWAFENRFIPDFSSMSLSDTKALLHSQIRSKGGVIPPDFIYLAVNAIQAAIKPSEAGRNMEKNRRATEISPKRKRRPNSGPCDIDSRTKIPIDQRMREQIRALVNQRIQTDELMERVAGLEGSQAADPDILQADVQHRSGSAVRTIPGFAPATRAVSTTFYTRSVSSPGSTGNERPKTASMIHNIPEITKGFPERRLKSAGINKPGLVGTRRYIQVQSEPVPMLMYSKEMKEKIESLKTKRTDRTGAAVLQSPSTQPQIRIGKVSEHNDPLRRNVNFKLRTHNQVEDEATNIIDMYKSQAQKLIRQEEAQKRKAWHSKVKETMQADKQNLFKSKMAAATTAIR